MCVSAGCWQRGREDWSCGTQQPPDYIGVHVGTPWGQRGKSGLGLIAGPQEPRGPHTHTRSPRDSVRWARSRGQSGPLAGLLVTSLVGPWASLWRPSLPPLLPWVPSGKEEIFTSPESLGDSQSEQCRPMAPVSSPTVQRGRPGLLVTVSLQTPQCTRYSQCSQEPNTTCTLRPAMTLSRQGGHHFPDTVKTRRFRWSLAA